MEMVQRLHRLELKTQGPGFTALNDLLNAWIAGTGLVLRIAEAGSMERFTIHLETSSIPAPAVAPLLGGLLFGARRRRR